MTRNSNSPSSQPPLTETLPRAGEFEAGREGPGACMPVARPGRFARFWRWLNDSWVGDMIGAVSLFVILWGMLGAGWVLS